MFENVLTKHTEFVILRLGLRREWPAFLYWRLSGLPIGYKGAGALRVVLERQAGERVSGGVLNKVWSPRS